jgi:hypothetical protein
VYSPFVSSQFIQPVSSQFIPFVGPGQCILPLFLPNSFRRDNDNDNRVLESVFGTAATMVSAYIAKKVHHNLVAWVLAKLMVSGLHKKFL